MEPVPDFLTVEEAARVMRIGRTKAYALTREWRATDGRSGMPVVDIGVLRVPRRQLEELLGVEILAVPTASDADTPGDLETNAAPEAPPVQPADTDSQSPAQASSPTANPTRPRRPRKRSRANSDQQSLPFA